MEVHPLYMDLPPNVFKKKKNYTFVESILCQPLTACGITGLMLE